MMRNFKDKCDKIPLWLINIISVISGLGTVASTVLAFIELFFGDSKNSVTFVIGIALVTSLFFNILLIFRISKYGRIETMRMSKITKNMHYLLHNVRDTYFKIMLYHKIRRLSRQSLSEIYKLSLQGVMDNLCSTINAYTSREVHACIKLITSEDFDRKMDINNATLVTFCRSRNSEHKRSRYEENNRPIFLRENSDFYEVVSPEFEKTHFYQGDLIAYDEEKKKNGERYKNSNPDWAEFYRGTIVVPIRIERDKLYHIEENDAYDIIGFLCVDSKSTDAFTKSMENYLVDMMYAYADVIYILLGQYRHYLRKFENKN